MSKLKKLTDKFIDQLAEGQREQYHSDLQPFEAYKGQLTQTLAQAIKSNRDAVKKGYDTLLSELKKERELASNPATLRPYEEFLIKGNNIPKGSKKSLQEKVGISHDVLTEMYDVASHLYQQKKYDDALSVLSFLIFLNPEIVTFWLAMGKVFESQEDQTAALEAYKVAIFMDPDNKNAYRNAVRCCVEQKNWSEAHKILDVGLQIVAEDSDKEEAKDLQIFLKKLQQLVNKKEGGL